MSKAMEEAKAMLPARLHERLESMCAEYKFACLKHHGFEMVSPRVIAELIQMNWQSVNGVVVGEINGQPIVSFGEPK